MPKITLSNSHSDRVLTLWLEPRGEDYWMYPGEDFTVEFDDGDYAAGVIGADGGQFLVQWEDDGLRVWAASGLPKVRDRTGTELECGHRRPDEVDNAWREAGRFGPTG